MQHPAMHQLKDSAKVGIKVWFKMAESLKFCAVYCKYLHLAFY